MIFNKRNISNVINSLAIFLLLCFFTEFTFTFFIRQFNDGMENKRFVYFSKYKRKNQYQLLKIFWPKKTKFTNIEGYLPNTSQQIHNEEFSFLHTYNADGLRDNRLISNMDSRTKNYILLGDSFAEGFGASDSGTISAHFNKIKNSTNSIMYNCGIAGNDPILECQLYDFICKKSSNNHVIICIFNNDLDDMAITLHQGFFMPTKEYLYAISHIFRILSIPFRNYIELENGYKKNKELVDYVLLQMEKH